MYGDIHDCFMAFVSGKALLRGAHNHVSSQSHRNGGGRGTRPLGRRLLCAVGPGGSRAQSDRARGQCGNRQSGLRRLGLGLQGRHHHERPGPPHHRPCASAGPLLASNTAVAWANDGSQNATIFTGGGSKDPLTLTGWAWKDQAGGLPDKDNLQDAFAARYSIPKSSTCPAPATATNCEVLFFGSDRFDNSGDAQQGFWFFQNKVTLDPATGKFIGVHKNGDLLILSDFSNGGQVSTINIYKWTGTDATGGLTFLTGGDDVQVRRRRQRRLLRHRQRRQRHRRRRGRSRTRAATAPTSTASSTRVASTSAIRRSTSAASASPASPPRHAPPPRRPRRSRTSSSASSPSAALRSQPPRAPA